MNKSGPRCGDKMEPQHKTGAATSMEQPVGGVQPSRVPCEICGKTFATHSEKDRHLESAHKRMEGHG